MNKKFFSLIALLTVIIGLIFTEGCSSEVNLSENKNDAVDISNDSNDNNIDGQLIFDYSLELEYANNFAVDFYKGGYIIFKDVENEQDYLIIPENKSVPKEIPEEIKILYAPINNLYVDSSAMVSLLSSFDGGLDSLKLVTNEKDNWYLENVANAMESGKIKYAGKYNSPDYEMLLENNVQLCICTTMIYSNPDVSEKFNELGIPYLVENSTKENHPLARMEWMKLMGIISGKEESAANTFNRQKEIIESISSQASDMSDADIKVAVFYYTNDGSKVYLRNSEDYIAKMLRLAGGVYIAEDLQLGESGTTAMTLEEFFKIVSEADYIFYMNYYAKFTTLDEFISFNEINKELKAVQNKKVWYTSPDFSQKANALGDIISDMNKILMSDENIDTDYLIYMK